MSSDDIEYYRARAAQERAAAADATQSEVAAIHLELARLYEALAEQPELRLGRALLGRAPFSLPLPPSGA
ncbi:hypothetical protein LZ496_00130 [Sphingomonas sp. NSE70-1]|uniref:Uncharacterized protein n=1 Tax=Sphingomonas caseinilyticus TaxID=2908205 RepID=A0ABT0RQC8_9SPHN|nr:hypothetical protein [Sphingomonas caseinilyticus]MCL6697198.1 hypothetical protein [Sphingomonas caseinilyticus]